MRIPEQSEWNRIEREAEMWPHHIGLIMDGNGRWAQMRNLPRAAGHMAGAEAYSNVTRAAAVSPCRVLSLYAFSADNWQRSDVEVEQLMSFPKWLLTEELRSDLGLRGAIIRFIGDAGDPRVPASTKSYIDETEELTKGNDGLAINIAFNYDARSTASAEWAATQPPVDLLVRSGGENRLSGFLRGLVDYAELVFSDTLWPDMRWPHVLGAVLEYSNRRRRFGREVSEVSEVSELPAVSQAAVAGASVQR
jgi:undecaprenyl diphosphate synthase